MKISVSFGRQTKPPTLTILGAFMTTDTEKKIRLQLPKWPKELKTAFKNTPGAKEFKGNKEKLTFYRNDSTYIAFGLGDPKKFDAEALRKAVARAYKDTPENHQVIGFHMDSFLVTNLESSTRIVSEALLMADYKFHKYLSPKTKGKKKEKEVVLISSSPSQQEKNELAKAKKVAAAVNIARDFVNEPPNVLRSSVYAERIKKDIQDNLKGTGVRTKILGRKELENQGMNLFLSVNDGSGFEPQLVHLTYTPPKATKNTKHIALVGKGLVFDTGGYSLKPATSIINMKYDMAGSATMYGAFRAAASLGLNAKITCILGITDNAISSLATMPDSIVKGRNGKTVEILNTDAEGRLVLGDCLDYACDQKPNLIIDAATLTGACLVALGEEICAVMGNNQNLVKKLLKSAANQNEYMWELPIIEEFQEDMKSKIADLRNIGNKHFGGASKAAAFPPRIY